MSMNAYLAAIDVRALKQLKADPDSVVAFIEAIDDPPPHELYLHKMWHAIHYMLTGTAWSAAGPLGQAILGGEEVGPNLGYGPARILTPDKVRATSQALAGLSVAEFRGRFDPSQMETAGIYPNIWMRERDTILEELTAHFENLTSFYRSTASRGDGALLWMQ